MKIIDILNSGKISLSFEVFPPRDDMEKEAVFSAARKIAELNPSFMSITFRTVPGTGESTVELAGELQQEFNIPQLAHLTCATSTKESVFSTLEKLKTHGIQNVLALRGDLPEGITYPTDYKYAVQLIEDIKTSGDFCIGAACYPEGHPEAATKTDDIIHLKEKVDAGCDFLTTQMFFDNNVYYNYLYRLRSKGIYVPVIAGIMPVTSGKQIKRICALSGTYLPERFKAIVDRFGNTPAAMKQVGIAYATEQIVDLIANDVNAIHVYTMNKPEIAAGIVANLSEIV